MSQGSKEIAEYIIKEYVPQDLKVLAIKYYREKTGAELAEAKRAVDNIFEQYRMYGTVYCTDSGARPDYEKITQYIVREYVPKNLLIQAIKYYREVTGVGLAEAKASVEEIFQRAKSAGVNDIMESVTFDSVAYTKKEPDTSAIKRGMGLLVYIVILLFGLMMFVIAAIVAFGVPKMKAEEIAEVVNEVTEEERQELLEWGYTEYITEGNYMERIWNYSGGIGDVGKKLWIFSPASGEEKYLGILWKYDDFGFDSRYCEGLSVFYGGEVKEEIIEGEHGVKYDVMVVDMEDVATIHGIPSWKVDATLENSTSEARMMSIPFCFVGLPLCYMGIMGIKNRER